MGLGLSRSTPAAAGAAPGAAPKTETGHPCLILFPPTKDDDKQEETYHHLLDFSKNKAEQIILPKLPRDQLIFNSWDEWLLTYNPRTNQIRLLNIFTKAQVELPPTSIDVMNHVVGNVVLSSSTPLDPNCVFMVICRYNEKLAFCKQGDKEWKILRNIESGRLNSYRDILYFKGEFYAVETEGKLVVCCDLDSPEPKVLNVVAALPPTIGFKSQMYLVESSGDLFLVLKTSECVDSLVDGRRTTTITRSFKVYKSNFSEQNWQRVNGLSDNSAIFVGHNVRMSISCTKFPGVKSDCIYFTDSYCSGNKNGCHDFGVFNLKTKLLEPTFLYSKKWPCPSVWVSSHLHHHHHHQDVKIQ